MSAERFYPYYGHEFDPVRDVVEDDVYGEILIDPNQELALELENVKLLDDYYLSYADFADYIASIGDDDNPLLLQIAEFDHINALLVKQADDYLPDKDVLVRLSATPLDREKAAILAAYYAKQRIDEIDIKTATKVADLND